MLGDKVSEGDKVEVKQREKKYRYFAYNKPRGIITHSAQNNEEDIKSVFPVENVFPVGRLDKDSYGLIILTDDGRIVDPLLNPDYAHEKEYEIFCLTRLPSDFKKKMETGVDNGGYVTKPCVIKILSGKRFSIVLTEGKKHQIRRMCGAFGQSAIAIQRKRIMNIKLGSLKENEYRSIAGRELNDFLGALGL